MAEESINDAAAREAPPDGTDAPPAKRRISVRELTYQDADAVINLLLEGFWDRSPDYWARAMQILRDRELPGPYPRFGYCLAESGRLVGVLLLIFSRDDQGNIRANVSSWYVQPEFRIFSNMLLAQALSRFPEVTFVNVSPSPHTLKTIGVQSFELYATGTFVAWAALGPWRPSAKISLVAPSKEKGANLLEAHAAMGCISLHVLYQNEIHPFIFLPRLAHRSGLKFAQLVYCKNLEDFVYFAGPLGRWLLKMGFLFVILDSTGPIDGLVGRYFDGRKVKCCRGPAKPRLGDLTNTELVLFGP